MKYENQVITLTMSFGIASCHQSEQISVDELIRRADNALYEAKSAGKNRSHVTGENKSKILRIFNKKCIESHE
jgi:diguanylate cyclase (GGDEF)-like protein